MTQDRDRLLALLCDLFPTAERLRWPFSVELAAERLIAAGVTFASDVFWEVIAEPILIDKGSQSVPARDDDERSKPVCVHGRSYGLHDEGEDCATFRMVREFGESLASVRVLGLTIDELRVAVATADQYHPQWRSSQIALSSQGE